MAMPQFTPRPWELVTVRPDSFDVYMDEGVRTPVYFPVAPGTGKQWWQVVALQHVPVGEAPAYTPECVRRSLQLEKLGAAERAAHGVWLAACLVPPRMWPRTLHPFWLPCEQLLPVGVSEVPASPGEEGQEGQEGQAQGPRFDAGAALARHLVFRRVWKSRGMSDELVGKFDAVKTGDGELPCLPLGASLFFVDEHERPENDELVCLTCTWQYVAEDGVLMLRFQRFDDDQRPARFTKDGELLLQWDVANYELLRHVLDENVDATQYRGGDLPSSLAGERYLNRALAWREDRRKTCGDKVLVVPWHLSNGWRDGVQRPDSEYLRDLRLLAELPGPVRWHPLVVGARPGGEARTKTPSETVLDLVQRRLGFKMLRRFCVVGSDGGASGTWFVVNGRCLRLQEEYRAPFVPWHPVVARVGEGPTRAFVAGHAAVCLYDGVSADAAQHWCVLAREGLQAPPPNEVVPSSCVVAREPAPFKRGDEVWVFGTDDDLHAHSVVRAGRPGLVVQCHYSVLARHAPARWRVSVRKTGLNLQGDILPGEGTYAFYEKAVLECTHNVAVGRLQRRVAGLADLQAEAERTIRNAVQLPANLKPMASLRELLVALDRAEEGSELRSQRLKAVLAAAENHGLCGFQAEPPPPLQTRDYVVGRSGSEAGGAGVTGLVLDIDLTRSYTTGQALRYGPLVGIVRVVSAAGDSEFERGDVLRVPFADLVKTTRPFEFAVGDRVREIRGTQLSPYAYYYGVVEGRFHNAFGVPTYRVRASFPRVHGDSMLNHAGRPLVAEVRDCQESKRSLWRWSQPPGDAFAPSPEDLEQEAASLPLGSTVVDCDERQPRRLGTLVGVCLLQTGKAVPGPRIDDSFAEGDQRDVEYGYDRGVHLYGVVEWRAAEGYEEDFKLVLFENLRQHKRPRFEDIQEEVTAEVDKRSRREDLALACKQCQSSHKPVQVICRPLFYRWRPPTENGEVGPVEVKPLDDWDVKPQPTGCAIIHYHTLCVDCLRESRKQGRPKCPLCRAHEGAYRSDPDKVNHRLVCFNTQGRRWY